MARAARPARKCIVGRLAALAMVGACTVPIAALSAQERTPSCGISTDWQECALRAGNIGDIAQSAIGGGGRELRFWTVAGLGVPNNLLIVRQRGDSVTGQLYLLWPASLRGDDFVKATCQREWWNEVGGLCLAHTSAPRDWKQLMRRLDEVGLSTVPGSPVPERPCRRPDPPPGQAPGDWICPILADGVEHILEVRTLTTSWRYIFPGIPDTTASGYARNRVLLDLLTCASQKRGDGPCVNRGGP